jgi:hypothetical protein
MPWLAEPSTLTTDVQPRAVDHPHGPFYEDIPRHFSGRDARGKEDDDCSGADTTYNDRRSRAKD